MSQSDFARARVRPQWLCALAVTLVTVLFIISLSAATPAFAEPSAVFTLYMSPNGSDSRNGRTPRTALRTLNGVQAKLKQYKPTIDQNIEVRIKYNSTKPYKGQTVEWTHISPSYTISFMPSDYQYGMGIADIAGRPVFVGDGSPNWFFYLNAPKGQRTNLRFYYLRIKGYGLGAIYLRGDPDPTKWNTHWNGYNLVYGCYFSNLGNRNYSDATWYGFGAVVLKNSDHNTIRNNIFRNLVNSYLGNRKYIHGVYLLNHSQDNLIESNKFSYISGDPIKVRDYSNYNDVFTNSFVRTGYLAYFLDAPKDGSTTECNSWRNEFRNNSPLGGGYSGGAILLYKLYDEAASASCPPLEPRLYTWGNGIMSP